MLDPPTLLGGPWKWTFFSVPFWPSSTIPAFLQRYGTSLHFSLRKWTPATCPPGGIPYVKMRKISNGLHFPHCTFSLFNIREFFFANRPRSKTPYPDSSSKDFPRTNIFAVWTYSPASLPETRKGSVMFPAFLFEGLSAKDSHVRQFFCTKFSASFLPP